MKGYNMYEIVRGPLMWLSVIIFLAGIIYRTVQLFVLTRKKEAAIYTKKTVKKIPVKDYSSEEKKFELLLAFQNSLLGKNPVMVIVSFVFHACLFIAPIFAAGHALSLYESWGFSFITLPDKFIDLLTIIFLACVLFFLMRRIVIPRVQSISTPYDYLLLFITAAPFLTGLYAYHQYFDYKTVITLHILAGELMLIVMPFTKLGHMVFFFFIRILIGSENSFGKGKRVWS
jgi:nitrate reductase gamma subunit